MGGKQGKRKKETEIRARKGYFPEEKGSGREERGGVGEIEKGRERERYIEIDRETNGEREREREKESCVRHEKTERGPKSRVRSCGSR